MLLVVAAVALALISVRVGRNAGGIEEHETLALVAVPTASGEADAGLGLWAAYDTMAQPRPDLRAWQALEQQGRRASVPTVVPIPAVEPAAAPVAPLRQPELRVPSGAVNWRALVEQYDWPVDEAVRIVLCESSGNPNAENGSSIGLMQINTAAHPSYSRAEMFDPAQNIKAAYAIWRDQGWGPWSCRP